MPKDEQFEILSRVLRRFHEAGILNELMLIGSWCLQFYRFHFETPEKLPAFRTLDVDFLIPHASKIKTEVDIPTILKEEGFVPTHNRASGMVKYNHPELQVEFLVPELGKGEDKPREIRKLHIKAQPLRYLNLLLNYPRLIPYEKYQVCVPEPAVFALHKLIISGRRKSKEKQKTDLETAVGLLHFLYGRPEEIDRVKSILGTFPPKWLDSVLTVATTHFPQLNETAKEIRIKRLSDVGR